MEGYSSSMEGGRVWRHLRRCKACGAWFVQYPFEVICGSEQMPEISLSDTCKNCDEKEGHPFILIDDREIETVRKFKKEMRKMQESRRQGVYQ